MIAPRKNSRDELSEGTDEFRGHPPLNPRVWHAAGNGRMRLRPRKKGVVVRLRPVLGAARAILEVCYGAG